MLSLATFDDTETITGERPASAGTYSHVDRPKLLSALFSLPSVFYDDYDKWVNEIAIPLKNAECDYFSAFDAFSQQSHKYKGIDDCRRTWDSLKPNGSKTIASIYFHATAHGWTWKVAGPTTIASLSDAEIRYPTQTMQELIDSDFREEYLIEDVLIRGVPGIFGGPAKAVKTGQLIDLAYNLSTGGKFLGRFQCIRSKILVLTGESGGTAIQRRTNTLIRNAGGVKAADDYFLISESLPKFKNANDLALLAVLLESKCTEVLVLDPLYLCMGGSEASNIQAQGELLSAIGDLCRKAHVTLVVAHHVTKAAARDLNRALTLEDLTQAGFDAWARQWWLVSRREKFELGSGVHKLLISVGNCSSHSAEWAVDIDEGTKDDPKWEVTVHHASDQRADDKSRRQDVKVEVDIEKVRRILGGRAAGLAQSDLRNKAGVSPGRWKEFTFPALVERRIVKEIPGKRANAPHYVLEDKYE